MAAAAAIALAAAALVCACAEARPSRRTTTDQRQQGELNIRASMENVLILVMPSSGVADLLSLASLKRPGLLQALLKRHKYDAATGDADERNDVDAEIAPETAPDRGDEEVVATVEEMKPPVTRRPTDPPPATAQVVTEKAQVTTEKAQVAMEEAQVVTEKAQVVTEKAQVGTEKAQVVTEKAQVVAEKAQVATEEAGPPRSTELAKLDATHSTEAPKEKKPEPTERPAAAKEQSVVSETVQQPALTVRVLDEAEAAAKPAQGLTTQGVDKRTEENTSTKVAAIDTTDKSEPIKSTEPATAAKEDRLVVSAGKNEHPKEKKPEAAKEQPWVIADFLKPAAAKEESKKAEEHGGRALAKKGAAEARREKALRYENNKWAPGLAGLLVPAADRGPFAAICAPGRWDTELRTCIMPGETRSRAELARFLEAMRFGISIPTK